MDIALSPLQSFLLCAGYGEVLLTTRDLHLRDPNDVGAQDPYPEPRPSTPAEALLVWLQVGAGQHSASNPACRLDEGGSLYASSTDADA